MRTIRLKFSDLFESEGAPPVASPDLATGVVGQRGLDYADPEPKYTLRSLPGEKFSGLQLMCLMFAGFKRVAPEQDAGIDLEEPFLTALELHQQAKGKPDSSPPP